ncbi:MAG: hypothetical protein CM15mP114_15690 [Alphaproteobacteria bacterium]|nr:MAG: hypothetical protein CM15mP114_15690 [Alphaproteobacteria bacterium]
MIIYLDQDCQKMAIHYSSGWGGNQSAGYIKLFENIDGTWTQIGKITGDSTLDNSGQLRLGISSGFIWRW